MSDWGRNLPFTQVWKEMGLILQRLPLQNKPQTLYIPDPNSRDLSL
jgi:hypothetical protein